MNTCGKKVNDFAGRQDMLQSITSYRGSAMSADTIRCRGRNAVLLNPLNKKSNSRPVSYQLLYNQNTEQLASELSVKFKSVRNTRAD